jgi:hypothetical protein
MKIRSCALICALAVLAGCGGNDSTVRAQFDETAPSTAISREQAQPIVHTFTEAGTYTLTVTGDYKASPPAPGDLLQVWFSFSGQGSVDGNAEPQYALSADGATAHVSQSINVTLTGSGPWQVTIACQMAGSSTGTLMNLRLHGVEH